MPHNLELQNYDGLQSWKVPFIVYHLRAKILLSYLSNIFSFIAASFLNFVSFRQEMYLHVVSEIISIDKNIQQDQEFHKNPYSPACTH
mmetsp:Transcript_5708/g.7293  ORF Transcript_5708/g.7293 Transcript_5708/m.7293 type:complete len:88 (+) Transcript_5708:90-353(+)